MQRLFEFIFNHYVYSLALAVVTYLLIQELFDTAFKKFNPITPMHAVAKMNESDINIIDVREPTEYVEGHIENAINAPLGKLSEQLPKLTRDKKSADTGRLPKRHPLPERRQNPGQDGLRANFRDHRRHERLDRRLQTADSHSPQAKSAILGKLPGLKIAASTPGKMHITDQP